jgi:hypothetical protein
MQIQSLTSSLYPRAVAPITQGEWQEQAQATTGPLPVANPNGKNKPVPTAARNTASPQQQLDSANDPASPASLPAGGRLTNEGIVQQQQSAAQFGSNAPFNTQDTEKRRGTTPLRPQPLSYSLASYTGQRANVSYLDVTGARPGRVVDELV